MRIQLKGIFTALLAVSAMLAGCEKQDKYLDIFPSSFDLDSDAQEVSAIVEASAAWMLYCTADWLKYSYGPNSMTIEIALPNESLEDRQTEITVISGDGLTRTVPVIQRAMNAYFDVDPPALQPFDGKGETIQTLTVSTNVSAWGFINSESWLTVVRGTGEGEYTLTLSVERSRDLDDRRDTVIVGPSNELFYSLTDSIPVVQKGVNLIALSDYMDSSYDIRVPAEGAEEVVVSVYAKSTWAVTDDSERRLVFDITTGGSDPVNGVPMIITVPENTTTEECAYILTFACGGENYTYQLIQAAAPDSGGEEEPEPEPEPEPQGKYRPKSFFTR